MMKPGDTTTFVATDEFAVVLAATQRVWPQRSTDYRITVVNRAGETVVSCPTGGSEKSARALANTAWTNLRAGVDPKLVWNT